MPRVAAILFATSLLACAVPGECQTGRQVKVVLEFQQQGQDSRQGAQGRVSGVVVQDGKARGPDGKARSRGGVAVQDTTTRTTRSEGISTIILDGGAASLLVATEVPVTVVGWFRDYATGQGYAAQGTAWQRIGGATRGINQATRQILGSREQQSSGESSFILTATVQ